jgi:hypothetical protein
MRVHVYSTATGYPKVLLPGYPKDYYPVPQGTSIGYPEVKNGMAQMGRDMSYLPHYVMPRCRQIADCV